MKVDIPAGIDDGQRMRVTGRGHAGERGGPAGDLYVVVRVKEDERFLRDREDLVTVVDVAAPLAALGTTIQVPTLDGDVPLEVPAGTQPGETIMMAGRGLPPLGRGRTGDLRSSSTSSSRAGCRASRASCSSSSQTRSPRTTCARTKA